MERWMRKGGRTMRRRNTEVGGGGGGSFLARNLVRLILMV
jgi:hypothetical protein